jgi:phosphomannomutase
LALPTVQTEKIIDRKFKIVLDPINSVGGIYVPALLAQLGVEVILINGEANGIFAHNPEPLPAHLTELSEAVRKHKADLGIAVDPDVDRLVLVNEDGTFFGEEYTLVAVADYILQNKPHAKQSAVVSNLSSSKALQDITEKHGAKYYASAVGEVHVVEKMKAVEAIIGGEGNGGIIDPSLHYGRDALLGIALILSYLALRKGKLSELRASYPSYYMAKEKIQLKVGAFFDAIEIQKKLSDLFPIGDFDLQDGIKRTLKNGDWVHIRASNTEPILRIYTESTGQENANLLAQQVIEKLNELAL